MAAARRALMLREGRAPVWDRLLTMLFLAGLLHGLIILGLTFSANAGDRGARGLDVILASDELPESDKNPNATYLAQRTQKGSGNTRESVAAHNRAAARPKPAHQGSVDGDSLSDSGDLAGARDEPVLTTVAWNTDIRYVADTGTSGTERDKPLLVDAPPVTQPGPEDEAGPAQLKGPQNDDLWITADTQASDVAPYLDGWRRKVERVGTLNYPAAARAGRAPGNPVVEVGILANGTLDRVVILSSSGNPALDQAALSILKLASPFDALPADVAAHHHVLRFKYEWQFLGGRVGGTLSTAP